MQQGEQRLEASHYADETFQASRVVRDCSFEAKSLRAWGVTAYHPTQNQPRSNFKRIFATPETGVPFLSASEMYAFRPTSDKYLSQTMRKLDELRVSPQTLLISRSGTVANPILVNQRLSRFAVTDDAIRISPGVLLVGYLYAFLASWIGRALVKKNQYGSAVKHLEATHILSVECPLVPQEEQQAIHNDILRAYELRDEANELLDEADKLLHSELGLPRFDKRLVPYLPQPQNQASNRPKMPNLCAFTTTASILDARLDCSYHVPVARTAISLLQGGHYQPVQLEEIVKDVCLPSRFKRIYVPKKYGVPFLQGSHLPQIKIYDLKYISNKANAKHIDSVTVRSGWILLTRSGTIGRVAVVSSVQDGWAVSEHLIRIIPDYEKGHPGYITAFLMTPYGQHQLIAKIYGAVVDELTEDDTKTVQIPNAPIGIQQAIGSLVITAFEKKEEAIAIEEAAIYRLESMLTQASEELVIEEMEAAIEELSTD